MVNILKRMRKLNRLLQIRNGAGAAILPQTTNPSHAPQVTRVHLAFPICRPDKTTYSARTFWHKHLTRLKYHNPALPITVQHDKDVENHPISLTVFWSDKPTSTEQVAQTKVPGGESQTRSVRAAEAEGGPDPNRSTGGDAGSEARQILSDQKAASTENPVNQDPTQSPIPPSSSTPTNSSPPAPTSDRTTSIPIAEVSTRKIWQWLKKQTGAVEVGITEEDKQLHQELQTQSAQAQIDRRQVKRGLNAMRKVQRQQREAKEIAARLTGEMA
ncbi:MAG: hypothetical protein Q9227_009354 [Pyrenula ochraceoflavens]